MPHLTAGAWTVVATTDDEGQLTMTVTNADQSEVIEVDEGIVQWRRERRIRLTTKKIEDEYRSQNVTDKGVSS